MQIHLLPQIPASLPGIHKLPAEFEAEFNVVRTSAPVPFTGARTSSGGGIADTGGGCAGYLRPPSVVRVVAVAGAYGALAAGPGDGVCDGGTGYGVDESGFSATCNEWNKGRVSKLKIAIIKL